MIGDELYDEDREALDEELAERDRIGEKAPAAGVELTTTYVDPEWQARVWRCAVGRIPGA